MVRLRPRLRPRTIGFVDVPPTVAIVFVSVFPILPNRQKIRLSSVALKLFYFFLLPLIASDRPLIPK